MRFVAQRSRCAFFNTLSDAAIVVRDAFDIILSAIVPRLYLDKERLSLSRVTKAMGRPAGNVDGFARTEGNLPVFDGRRRLSADKVPMLRPASVALEAQALPRINADPLDLVVRLVGQIRVVPPRTVIGFHDALLKRSSASQWRSGPSDPRGGRVDPLFS